MEFIKISIANTHLGGEIVRSVSVAKAAASLVLGAMLLFSGLTAAQTEITFMSWYGGSNQELLRSILDDFEAENPEYTVTLVIGSGGPTGMFEQVLVQAAGGTPPDVTMTQHGMQNGLFSTGQFEDLTPWIDRDLAIDTYFPELIRFWNANHSVGGGGQYALPLVSYAQALYFNVDLFNENGLETPILLHERGAWSRQAFEEAARKITRPGGERYGFTSNPGWIRDILIHNHGGRIYNQDATRTLITSDEVVGAVQWQADLVNFSEIAAQDTWDHQIFANGNDGMFITAAWMSDILNQTEINYDAAPIFYTGEPRPHHEPSGDGIAMLSGSGQKEGAWKLIKHFMSADVQRTMSAMGIPVHGDVARDPALFANREVRPYNYAAFVYELAEKTALFYPPGIPPDAGSLIDGAANRVYAGEVSAQVAFSEIEDSVNAILAEWHQRERL